ncbi:MULTISPECIES: hypothetical protein [unclassified Streptomyces]|uniref:hypothetical protein n=1 Tax=unclassified Streptomyces TaxID=2593676 RepID=UPI002E287B2C|nr:hypothetical protein [Streptomyces sp. NBC_01429]
MDYRQFFSDGEAKQEFFDRFDEIKAAAATLGGLEGLDSGLRIDQVADTVERMTEGVYVPQDTALEKIINEFYRPVHLIQGGTFSLAANGFPTSDVLSAQLKRLAAPSKR